MTKELAEKFTYDWIASWNKHDLEEILSHYSDDIHFYSPFIQLLKFNETGSITSKEELKKYFEIGLNAYPELRFELHHYFVGVSTVVIYYTSVNGRLAAEVFELSVDGKVKKVYCNYSETQTI